MIRRLARIFLPLAALLGAASPAEAHIVAARLGDFYSGALHPLTDLQEMILWVALGVLAGSFGDTRGKWLVLAFPLGLLAGLGAGLAFGGIVPGPLAEAAMMVGLGVLMATAVSLPAPVVCLIAAGLALVRGMAAADNVTPEVDGVLFGAGLATAGYVTITLVSALALTFRGLRARTTGGWRDITIRACGSWIAAVGLMLGDFALAS